uniref:YggT family protein n=1 Tax=Ishige okamurae TaxID=233772 RepID=A0A8E5XRH1_9PHAE|nr:hypothetical protein Ycf19 [Ishige okamurae]QVJ99649.1 hypothetical protein Ycf19 [Ishige okamurae]WAM64085.1 hypothetical protein [Ishige okamurae]
MELVATGISLGIDNSELLAFLNQGIRTIKYLVKSYYWILTLRLSMQWFPNINPYVHPMYALLYLTDPFLENFEGLVPNVLGMDMSSMLAFICLEWIIRTLDSIAFY